MVFQSSFLALGLVFFLSLWVGELLGFAVFVTFLALWLLGELSSLGFVLLGLWVSEFLGSGGFLLLLGLFWTTLGEFTLGFLILLSLWVSEFLGGGGFLLLL